MNLSLRIPLVVLIIVVITGAITFIRITAKARPFPGIYFLLWIAASVILIGITTWPWMRNRKKAEIAMSMIEVKKLAKKQGVTKVDALTFSAAAGDVLNDFLSIERMLA